MASQPAKTRRIAVVLFNLGGPDSLTAVRPFLFNLFADRAIINLPAMVRYPLAALISTARGRSARLNYARMGGASPLNRETKAQAEALETLLTEKTDGSVKVFVSMRYWAPMSVETAAAVAGFAPDEVILLPLYPQYSTTTTGSSLKAWTKAYKGPGRVRAVCCYPTEDLFIGAHVQRIEDAFEAAGRPKGLRLLFSAHGLPETVIAAGDPYQAQIEATAAALAGRLPGEWDWRVCYQSRVGPMAWIGPSTLDEIAAAKADGVGVLIVPIAFVSEHVETLVELDHDYAGRAAELGVSPYIRVPTLGVHPNFISALAAVAIARLNGEDGVEPGSSYRCAGGWGGCPCGTDCKEKAA